MNSLQYNKKRKHFIFLMVTLTLVLFFLVAEGATFLFTSETLKKRAFPRLRSKDLEYLPAKFTKDLIKPLSRHEELQIKINSHGYRGSEFSIKKDPNTLRIIIYGGSSVFDIFAKGLNDWPTLLGHEFKRNGYNVEVINAGIPGHSSYDSYGRFFSEDHLLNPDVVIISHWWNDQKSFYKEKPLLKWNTKQFSYHPLKHYLNPIDKFLGHVSFFYNYIRAMYFIHWEGYNVEGKEKKHVKDFNRITDVSLAQLKVTMGSFADLSKREKATIIFMAQPTLVTTKLPDSFLSKIGLSYMNYDLIGLTKGYEETQNILRELADEREEIIHFDQHEMNGKAKFFNTHVHFNQLGSLEVSNRLFQFFRNEPILRKKLEEYKK